MASSFRSDDALLSGSLTQLKDGSQYLIGGAGISIVTGSSGQITIINDGTVGDITSVVAGTGLSGGGTTGDVTLNIGAGTGIDVAADAISVDVSDFMTNGVDNRVITATGTDTMNAEANLSFDGSTLSIAGSLDADGSATFNESAAEVDFRVETKSNQNMFIVKGSTDRVGIGTVSAPQATLHLKESSPVFRIQRSSNASDSSLQFAGSAGSVGGSLVHLSGSNDLVFSTFDGSSTQEILRLGGHQLTDIRQVVLLSGSSVGETSTQPKLTSDINFFVSGSIGSKNSTTRGTAVFGGDVVISGSLHGGSPLKISGGMEINTGGMEITGSANIKGDVSINQGNFLRFSEPGDSNTPHQSIVGGTDSLTIEADNTLNINSDETVQITCTNSTSDDQELIRLSAAGFSSLSVKPSTIQINGSYQDTDFIAGGNGEANQGLIYIDAADNSILFGGKNLGFGEFGGSPTTNRPADIKAELGYGDDVKILLSGSRGTKGTSTRGVTLVTSDLVISGNLYHGASGNSIIRSTEHGRIRNLTEANLNTGVFLSEEEVVGQDTNQTGTSFRTVYVCHSSGSFEKLSFRFSGGATIESQGGLTASFHLGKSGKNVNEIDTNPDFLEEVFLHPSNIEQDRNLHFVFSGSNFEPGDAYSLRIKSDANGAVGSNLFGAYALLISHFS